MNIFKTALGESIDLNRVMFISALTPHLTNQALISDYEDYWYVSLLIEGIGAFQLVLFNKINILFAQDGYREIQNKRAEMKASAEAEYFKLVCGWKLPENK